MLGDLVSRTGIAAHVLSRLLIGLDLVDPLPPPRPWRACDQFQIRAGTARFYYRIKLIGLSRVLLLAGFQKIDLAAARVQRPHFALDAEQHQFGHVAKVESAAAPIRPTIFPYLVPDYVGLVRE